MTMFPTKLELKDIENSSRRDEERKEKDRKSLDKQKKYAFQMNSGLLKFATINSFKGMESKTIFYILDRHDNAELVYTAITRARENLIIYDLGNDIFAQFFTQKMENIPFEE